MTRVSSVLFDIDGTLLNTVDLVCESYRHSLHVYDRKCPGRRELLGMLGPPISEVYELLAPDIDPAVLLEEHLSFQKRHTDLVQPYPGAVRLLERLKSVGISTATVSSRSSRTTSTSLAAAGLSRFIDIQIAAEDVVRHKPHPEGLFLALSRLGTRERPAIMVGDTDVDISAGRSAGMETVGVTYGFHGNSIWVAAPTYIASTCREIELLLVGDSLD